MTPHPHPEVLGMEILIPADRIQTRIDELGREIAGAYPNHEPVTIIGVLTGSLVFLADLIGRLVLLLDDILDTGQTLSKVTEKLKALGPRSVRVAVLLRKLGRQRVPFEPDFCGFEIPDAFVVGYGLDYNDEYRHLPYIAILPDDQRPLETRNE